MNTYQLSIKKVKKHSKQVGRFFWDNIILVSIPSILFSCLLFLSALSFFLQKDLQDNKLYPFPFFISKPAAYPVLGVATSSANVSEETFSISAHSAVVMDDASKVILFSKNPTFRFSMASTTKIMTALVALSYYKENDILTIKNDQVPGTVVGFKNGEQYYFPDVLYALMLPSGNDAAQALADNYLGGEDAFVAKMNEYSKDLYLLNTHYGDPAGLMDDDDYTTVVDLAHLASFAIKNPILAKVVATREKTINTVDFSRTLYFVNLNKLLGVNGVTGIKTGFTDEAKGVLVTAKKEENHTLILVVMKSEDRFFDTMQLISLVSGKTIYQSMNR